MGRYSNDGIVSEQQVTQESWALHTGIQGKFRGPLLVECDWIYLIKIPWWYVVLRWFKFCSCCFCCEKLKFIPNRMWSTYYFQAVFTECKHWTLHQLKYPIMQHSSDSVGLQPRQLSSKVCYTFSLHLFVRFHFTRMERECKDLAILSEIRQSDVPLSDNETFREWWVSMQSSASVEQ